MSRRKDRERASSGFLVRSGVVVSKEDWYAAHQTPEMKKDQQAKVDTWVEEEMAKKEVEGDSQNKDE
jgi:uridine phosphorylase